MATEHLPEGLVPAGSSLEFTEDTVPAALQKEHALGPGHWGVLHVFAGSVCFVDLATGAESVVAAPDHAVIRPEAPHHLRVTGPVRCRIDFFREPEDAAAMRTPGGFAEEVVKRSFARCEANGDFAETFYTAFMNASPAIAPFFAQTEFGRQRQLLRDSVYLMVTHDVSDPDMRALLDKLGQMHSRVGRNIAPKLYELWLDSICATVKQLDPEWSQALEDHWRVRLRAGRQIIMAAY